MKSNRLAGAGTLTFDGLLGAIRQAHVALAADAARALNRNLTLRNWVVGAYLVEYEQRGADRAAYGARLLDSVAERLRGDGLDGVAARSLRLYRQFYLGYPEIWQTSAKSLRGRLEPGIVGTPFPQSLGDGEPETIREAVTPESGALVSGGAVLAGIVERLTFSHFVELLAVVDPLARRFYEAEALRGNWSVRELKRQIATQYFERTGLSTDRAALARQAHASAERQAELALRQVIRDPYVFEFLGLAPHEVMGESALEDALLDKLQAFLLELGHGFCFEARQKRLVIGGERFFVDLVFYHRVLKCHVLVELKADAFRHEHLGQLNAYVSYYRETQMTEGDQPPVGILLCTAKNHELVEYALAGMANTLFVSRYQVRLPGKEEMTAFVQRAVEELGGRGE